MLVLLFRQKIAAIVIPVIDCFILCQSCFVQPNSADGDAATTDTAGTKCMKNVM